MTQPRAHGVRRAHRLTLAAAVVCVPAVAATVALTVQADSAAADTQSRQEALAAAPRLAQDLLSYDYRTIGADVARAESETTGAFAHDYAGTAAQLQAAARQTRAIVQATASSAGVVSAAGPTVVVLVFVDQASVKQAAGQRRPTTRIDQSRVQLTLTRVGTRWKVAALSAL